MAKARRTRNAGERFRITATVERFGEKNGSGPPVKMVLLKDVCDASTGITLTDQLRLAAGGWAEHLGALQPVCGASQKGGLEPGPQIRSRRHGRPELEPKLDHRHGNSSERVGNSQATL